MLFGSISAFKDKAAYPGGLTQSLKKWKNTLPLPPSQCTEGRLTFTLLQALPLLSEGPPPLLLGVTFPLFVAECLGKPPLPHPP